MTPNPCPSCHSPMAFEEPGAAAEIYGWCIQDNVLACTNERCETRFSLSGDFMYLKVGEQDLVDAWNRLTPKQALPSESRPASASSPYLKMYIAVLDAVPDFMVPTLVAHSILNAHRKFTGDRTYEDWLANSFRKVVLRVNAKEFQKISQLECHLGHENTTLGGQPSCAVVLPVMSDAVPNVLKFAKTWAPAQQQAIQGKT